MVGDTPSLPSTPPQVSEAAQRIQLITNSLATQASVRTLEVGQVVNARILDISHQSALRLEIDGQRLTAKGLPDLELRPGQTIQLQLISTTQPPLFRVLLTTDNLNTEQAARAQLLRQLLPHQSGFDHLFEQLGRVLTGRALPDQAPPINLQQHSSLEQGLVQLIKLISSQQFGPTQTQLHNLGQLLQQLSHQSPTTTQPGNSQLQQALSQLAQQLSSQNPTSTQPGNSQLQQALSQLTQQLSGQNPSTTQPGNSQLQQALSQLAQQLSHQNPTTTQPSSRQLQQALSQLAQHSLSASSSPQTNAQTSVELTAQAASSAASTTPQTRQAQELSELLKLLGEQSLNEKQLGPEVLRGLFLTSGIFLEANLAQNRTPRANDLKSLLLRMVTILQSTTQQGSLQQLVQQLIHRNQSQKVQNTQEELQTQMLTQLRKAAEGALAKLELQQLQSLPQKEDETRQGWHFVLTLTEDAKFREVEAHISREKARKQQDVERWHVELHFDFEASGPMDARIQLQQSQIQVNFWASRSQTLERIKTLLPRLERALAKAGLEVTQLGAWPGAQPKPKDCDLTPASGLVNLRA